MMKSLITINTRNDNHHHDCIKMAIMMMLKTLSSPTIKLFDFDIFQKISLNVFRFRKKILFQIFNFYKIEIWKSISIRKTSLTHIKNKFKRRLKPRFQNPCLLKFDYVEIQLSKFSLEKHLPPGHVKIEWMDFYSLL